jgi:hypothetical protein
MEMVCQRHAPGTIPPEITRCPLYRRLVRPHGLSGRVRKSSFAPRFDPQTDHPVVSRYTNYAISALKCAVPYIIKIGPRGKSGRKGKSRLDVGYALYVRTVRATQSINFLSLCEIICQTYHRPRICMFLKRLLLLLR